MTREDLMQIGFREELCKVGYLYFKGDFFCKLNDDGSVDFRLYYDDLNTFGIAHNIEEIKELEKKYYTELRDSYLKKAKEIDFLIELIYGNKTIEELKEMAINPIKMKEENGECIYYNEKAGGSMTEVNCKRIKSFLSKKMTDDFKKQK